MVRRGWAVAGRWLAVAAAVLLLAGCVRATPAGQETLPSSASPHSVTAAPLPTAPGPASEELGEDAARTLASLVQVDDYPLYTMRYAGPYEPRPVSSRGGVPRTGAGTARGWACSLFAAMGDPEQSLYGRNFDWEFSPALLLFTDPADGYASVSMVDIAYLGFGEDRARGILGLPLAERRPLLQAPWLPFDGMNEAGLAVGMADVPGGDVQPDPAKPTIGSLRVIREMLDHAGSVEEAIALLKAHNIDFSGGPPLHYLVADRSGRAALVELYGGSVHVTYNVGPRLHATNFLVGAAGEAADGRCWRYDQIGQRLGQAGGKMTPEEAMDLLVSVGQPNTQWSVVYGMATGAVQVVMGRRSDAVHRFDLPTRAASP